MLFTSFRQALTSHQHLADSSIQRDLLWVVDISRAGRNSLNERMDWRHWALNHKEPFSWQSNTLTPRHTHLINVCWVVGGWSSLTWPRVRLISLWGKGGEAHLWCIGPINALGDQCKQNRTATHTLKKNSDMPVLNDGGLLHFFQLQYIYFPVSEEHSEAIEVACGRVDH